MAIDYMCFEGGEPFAIDTGVLHSVGGDAPHRQVECLHCGSEQCVKASLPPGP